MASEIPIAPMPIDPGQLQPVNPVNPVQVPFIGNEAAAPTLGTMGMFVVAIMAYLMAISFMSPRAGTYMSIILVLGALIVNQQKRSGHTVFDTLGLK